MSAVAGESFKELANWTAKQLRAVWVADRYQYTLYGGSRGPGKSYWLRWYLLRQLLRLAARGIRGAVVGLFSEDYPSLKDRQIGKISVEFPAWLGEVKDSQEHGLGFHLRAQYGGGVLALRNLDDPTKYQSAEFAAIGVEELARNPVEKFHKLRGSLRWPGVYRPVFVAVANPGGIGHLFVKAYWIDREFPPEMAKIADRFAFVPALPDDNPYLTDDYWDMLDTLPGDLAQAWRWGNWDVFEGQAFAVFRRDKHVVEPRRLPEHWPRWRCVDWGFAKPFCCLWLALDPDTGRVWVYREAYETGLTDRAQALLIRKLSPPTEALRQTLADPSMWTKKTHEDVTFSTADEYAAAGVPLVQADNDRLTGKRKVGLLLEDLADGAPGLVIMRHCRNLIRTLPALPYDDRQTEDVDTQAEDHPYDALRYGLDRINPRPAPKASDRPKPVDPLLRKAGRGVGLSGRDF